MTEHTPGPWIRYGLQVEATPSGHRYDIAYIASWSPYLTPELTNANGNLIAAAPDLLAACQEALQQLNAEGLDRMPAAIHARAAIAKAKGEQQ